MSAHRGTASLAPILVALMTLVSMSLLGFIVALWPAEPRAEARPREESRAPAAQTFEGGSHYAPAPDRGLQSKWM
jgi:hypothetical protein